MVVLSCTDCHGRAGGQRIMGNHFCSKVLTCTLPAASISATVPLGNWGRTVGWEQEQEEG